MLVFGTSRLIGTTVKKLPQYKLDLLMKSIFNCNPLEISTRFVVLCNLRGKYKVYLQYQTFSANLTPKTQKLL